MSSLVPKHVDKDAVFVTAANILPFYQMKVFLGGRKNREVKYGFMKGMHFAT